MKRIVALLFVIGMGVAAALMTAQHPFAKVLFEFEQYRDYEGVLADWPQPTLITKDDRYLLVSPGKHGFASAYAGRIVRLKGSLIRRGSDSMLEVVPESVQPQGEATAPPKPMALGSFTLQGEIVDSKCFLGVMNPGSGTVHHDCAVRCISGGIPAAFLVRDAAGVSRVLLLDGMSKEAILAHVAAPITLHGQVRQVGKTLILTVE